jgi:hypothetical protein
MKRTLTAVALTATVLVGGSAIAAPAFAATSPSPAPTHSTGANGANRQAFRACLAQHGIKLPARPSGQAQPTRAPGQGFGQGRPNFKLPSGVTQQQFQSAMQACGGGFGGFAHGGGFGGAGKGVNSSAFAAFTSCMKDHGVTLPTPGAKPSGKLGGINRQDPAVKAAMKICGALLPSFGSAHSSTTNNG